RCRPGEGDGGKGGGRCTRGRPQKYVQGFVDRHGKPRYYLRRSGHKSVPLPGLPWTPAFMAAYQAAMEGAPRVEFGARRTQPGTVAPAVMSDVHPAAFRNLANEAGRNRNDTPDRLREQHGDKRIALLRPDHIKAILAAKAGTPQTANKFLKTLRAMMQHCIAEGMCTDDPTRGIRGAK